MSWNVAGCFIIFISKMYKKIEYDLTTPNGFSEDGFSRGMYLNQKETLEGLKVQIKDLLFIIPQELYKVSLFKWFNLRLASYTVTTLLPLKNLYKEVGEKLKKQYPELVWKNWDAGARVVAGSVPRRD